MDLNVKTQILHVNELLFSNSSEQPIDSDITMPDYCPDIKKILKCVVLPRLVSARCTADRVNVEANAQIQIMYSNEDNNVFCYEKTFPFSKSIDIGKPIENPVVEAKLRTSYVNTRAVSSRRIDIHSSVVVDVTIKSKKEEQVVADAENCGIQLLKNCKNVCSFVGEAVKMFSLTETVDLGEGKSPVFQVLRVTSNIVNEDMKATKNKVLVTGELKVNVLYCADTDKHHPEVFEHTLPISQIIDVDSISDKTDNSVSICCSGVEVVPKNDSSGAKKLLDISASINAVIKAVTNIDTVLPTDCYSTQYDLKCQKKTFRFENEVEKIIENMMIKKNEKLSGIKIDEIYDVWCDDIKATSRIDKGEINVKGSLLVCILGKDESSVPFYTERTVEFDKVVPMKGENNSCRSDTNVKNMSVSYILSSEDTLDLRIEIMIESSVVMNKPIELIESIQIDKESKKKKSSALSIYFADENESVWDIARNFNTTPNVIREENELDDSDKAEKRMLFIPII